MKIEIKLNKSERRKLGHPLIISIYNSKHDRSYPYTGFYSEEKDWDFTLQMPKSSHQEYEVITNYILKKRVEINDIKLSGSRLSSEQIKNKLFGNSESIYDFWKVRINEKNRKKKDSGVWYENVLSEFLKFRKELKFADVDYSFLTSFKQHKWETCNAGGINAYLKAIRAVYNEGIKRGLYEPKTFISPFSGILEPLSKSKDKYLTIDDMRRIYAKKDKSKRDKYFLLCFYIGGVDFIDIAKIKLSEIKNDRVVFKRNKNGLTNEVIDNFIFPEAWEIINELGANGYITDINKSSRYATARDNFMKRYRKDLEALGIESYFSTKSARYTFINIGKQLMLNREVIKELVGHSRSNDITSVYEGGFSNAVKDEVHQRIIDEIKIPPETNPAEQKNKK